MYSVHTKKHTQKDRIIRLFRQNPRSEGILNHLKNKPNLLSIKNQSVPLSKQFPPRL
jgi:hypothetical protein